MTANDMVKRLVDSDEESEDVRSLLAAGIADEVDYDYDRGLTKHVAAVAALPTATGSAAGPHSPNPGTLVRLGSMSSKALVAWVGVPLASLSIAAAVVGLGGHSPSRALHGLAKPAVHPAASPDGTARHDENGSFTVSPDGTIRRDANGPFAAPVGTTSDDVESAPLGARDPARTREPSEPPGAPARGLTKLRAGPRGAPQAPGDRVAADEVPESSAAIVRSFPDEARAQRTSSPERREAVLPDKASTSARSVASTDVPEKSEEQAAREERAREEARKAEENRLNREMEELMRAKRALSSDPKLALDLARHGEAEFRQSLLSEERQHVLLLALIALGRLGEAERLAAPYLAKHPDSPFARRVRSALDAASKQRAR